MASAGLATADRVRWSDSSRAPASRLRVLQVYRTFFPDTQGGLEDVVRTLSEQLASRGLEVVVLYPSRHVTRVEERVVGGVRLCRVPQAFEVSSCNVFLAGLGAFRRWAAWADVVHYHFPWPFADVLHLCAEPRGRARHVLTYHSDIVRQQLLARLYTPLRRRFLRRMDAIVATSELYASSSPVLREQGRRVRVIPIGLDCERIPPPEPDRLDAWRARVGENFFLFVGVLRYYKGLDVLLRAAAGTGLPVVIVGDGPERRPLEGLARQLRTDNVTFAGRVPDADKWALLALARAFVFPSNRRSEAYGVALLEAMAFGRPLVTANIGTGVNFVNRPGETGLCVAAGDAHALRDAMQRLAGDDALCARLGAGALARVTRELSAPRMVTAYTDLYAELCPWAAAAPADSVPVAAAPATVSARPEALL